MPARRLLILSLVLAGTPSARADIDPLQQLLQSRRCPQCRLNDADLVHADLRDADLQGAELQRANLSQARLDGANLSDSDLRFTSLKGASLRGADLRGSRLYGTDLRGADLIGAVLEEGALEQSHWAGAQGVAPGALNHADLHNAGVDAAQAGRWPEAERLFSAAIQAKPKEALSWVARGICRSEQIKDDSAAADFRYAGLLFERQGNTAWAQRLRDAAQSIEQRQVHDMSESEGSGLGHQLLEVTMTSLRLIAPIAAKALIPIGLGL